MGEVVSGQAMLAPIRALEPFADVFGPMPYPAVQGMLAGGALPGLRSYTTSGYLADLSDDLIHTLLERGARLATPMSQLHLHQMGGAVARVGEDDTAFGHRSTAFTYNIIGTWAEAGGDAHGIEWVRDTSAAVRPFASSGVYVNFLGAGEEDRVRAAYDDAMYARLASLKRRYDPANLFRRNHNILPA